MRHRVVDEKSSSSGAASLFKRFGHRIHLEYRRFATGLCFLTFMTGGLLLTLTLVPLLHILPLRKATRERLSVGLVQRSFALFLKLMCLTGTFRFIVEGLENIDGKGPFLFVANHPTLIDVVALMATLRSCNCIVKKNLFQHPFMGGVLRGAGLLSNDNGPALVESVRREFDKGRNLMIWPEGTRSPVDGLHPFQRGAARIALHTGAAIVPVVITCDPPTLKKGQPWYDVPNSLVILKLSFREAMALPPEVVAATSLPLKVRALNNYLETFFREALGLTPGGR